MKRHQFILIRVDGTETVIKEKPTIDAIYRAIGCICADHVTLSPSAIMMVDDTGMIDGKAVNEKATALVKKVFGEHYPYSIHGDVVIVNGGGFCFVNDYTGGMTALEQERAAAIRHVIHEYANFVSSAEMVLSGLDIGGIPFKPPINTHISHAFYLNCRKLADFFQNHRGGDDDIMAEHYAPGFSAPLPVCDDWRGPMNKQLTHVTYAREKSGREIDSKACRDLYAELKTAWREFRAKLVGGIYEAPFKDQLTKRKEPYPDGHPPEFLSYDLE